MLAPPLKWAALTNQRKYSWRCGRVQPFSRTRSERAFLQLRVHGRGLRGAMEGIGGADAGQGQERLQGLARVLLGEGLLLPELRVLVFQRDAGGEADVAVLVAQVRPGDPDGSRVLLAVKRLQPMAQGPLLRPG